MTGQAIGPTTLNTGQITRKPASGATVTLPHEVSAGCRFESDGAHLTCKFALTSVETNQKRTRNEPETNHLLRGGVHEWLESVGDIGGGHLAAAEIEVECRRWPGVPELVGDVPDAEPLVV